MGMFSIWHWLILLFVFALLASVVGLVFWLAMRASNKPGNPVAMARTRLRQLEELKAEGLISNEEYARQRAVIVREL